MKNLVDKNAALPAILLLVLLVACTESSNGGQVDAGGKSNQDNDAGIISDPFNHKERVDLFWGPAPDLETRMYVFDEIWETLAEEYPGFTVSELDWDEVRSTYRPQMELATSYGRFYAVLSHMVAELRDSRVFISSDYICGQLHYHPRQAERPPFFHLWDKTSVIGACATSMPDDRLLVYSTEAGNPAGLEPGDFILGYDGRTWRQNLEIIDREQMPVCGLNRTVDSAYDYNRMNVAVNNAHLFQSMEVLKKGASSPESINTDRLIGYESDFICSDQVGVDAVDPPYTSFSDLSYSPDASWGILSGTNIGYICNFNSSYLYTAVEKLLDTDGLIIDQRLSWGSSSFGAALSMLFNETHDQVIGYVKRLNEDDYFKVNFEGVEWRNLLADVDKNTFYDHPIAVLQGTKAASGGDEFPYYMSLHPYARRFGRVTNGGFLADEGTWVGEGINFTYAGRQAIGSDLNFLQEDDVTPEEQVWLDPDDVANGIDTVVEAALAWIEEENSNK